jgi:hypothetical protein
MTAETAEQKLSRYDVVINLQMAEIDRLRAEVKRLVDCINGDADALTCLQSIYNNPEARLKAIGLRPRPVPCRSSGQSGHFRR